MATHLRSKLFWEVSTYQVPAIQSILASEDKELTVMFRFLAQEKLKFQLKRCRKEALKGTKENL